MLRKDEEKMLRKEVEMEVLANLEPRDVFHFFEEIAGIPHGSGSRTNQ